MTAWKKYTIALTCMIIFALNLFLILDSEHKISRLQLIDKFILPKEIDLVQSIEKPGVITSRNEEYIYYHESLGSLGDTYVEEGQEVEMGDPLFTYTNIELASAESELNGKLDQIDLRSEQLSEEINTLTSMKDDLESTEDDSEAVNHDLIGQYQVQILQKEHQIEELELEKEIYEQALHTLGDQQQELEITSPVTGFIKEISSNQNDPFLTIVTTPLIAKGELTELESLDIKEGLDVLVRVHDNDPIEGTLALVSHLPAQDPALDQETSYPFYVNLEDEEDMVKTGYHVSLEIIQNLVPNATVIPSHSLQVNGEEHSAIVAHEGYLQKRQIELGLAVANQQEVTNGLTTSDLLVAHPASVIENQPFVTKLQLDELDRSDLSSFGKMNSAKLVLKGFMQ